MAKNMSANKRAGSVRWLYEAQDGLCAICSGYMPEPDCPNEGRAAMLPHSPTVDHIKPKVRGGSDRLENLLLVHKVCNEAKGMGAIPISAKKIRMRVWGKIQTLRAEEKASIEAAKVKQAEFKAAVEQARIARLGREENSFLGFTRTTKGVCLPHDQAKSDCSSSPPRHRSRGCVGSGKPL